MDDDVLSTVLKAPVDPQLDAAIAAARYDAWSRGSDRTTTTHFALVALGDVGIELVVRELGADAKALRRELDAELAAREVDREAVDVCGYASSLSESLLSLLAQASQRASVRPSLVEVLATVADGPPSPARALMQRCGLTQERLAARELTPGSSVYRASACLGFPTEPWTLALLDDHVTTQAWVVRVLRLELQLSGTDAIYAMHATDRGGCARVGIYERADAERYAARLVAASPRGRLRVIRDGSAAALALGLRPPRPVPLDR